MKSIFVFLMASLIFQPMFSQVSTPPNPPLMPMPSTVKLGEGELLIDPSFSVGISGHSDPMLKRAMDRFLDDLRRQTGMLPLDMKVTDAAKAFLVVHADHEAKAVMELGEDESYSLVVTSSGAKLDAPTTLGVMHGLETFLQLVKTGRNGFDVPVITIHDQPRFPWRGLMIDSSRHFTPINVLKRNLDGMAAVKLNVFHWHLSDNQGFRVESKKFPKLQEMGSDGLYYTQEQIRDLIAYAHDRGIRVVPEFDMPGHSTAWFVGYPKLASAPGPYSIERHWGVFDPAMDPTAEHTYKFLNKFIGEMAKLFPDKFFHIGGDEVNGKQWDANPKIQKFMHAHGLKTDADLQAYFNTRVQKIVAKHGKTMEGWDEILRPDLPKDIVIQSWRGSASLADAAKQGYRGLLSSGYYLDLGQPASQHYAVDPLGDGAADLTPQQKRQILGGEACMWSEYVSPENIDSRIWPRMAAIAERLWSPQSTRDVNAMYERLDEVSRDLDWLGLTHNSSYFPMLRRIAGSDDTDIAPLRVLADVVEPVKGYTRGRTSPVEPTSAMPLNRLIDAARPESSVARRFSDLVDAFIAGQATPEDTQEIRSLLFSWRDNQQNLQPLEAQSFLLKEVIPVSQDLSGLAETGIQALDYLYRGERASDDWKTQHLAFVRQASQPKAQVLIMIAPSIGELVEAAAGK
ncbi:MAG: beta-N-acetylhexosaminidase [Terriglobales bacterium]